MASFHESSITTLGKAGTKNGKSAEGRTAAGTSPLCPECGSNKTWKDGIRETRFGPVQRYLCRTCGFRFSLNGSDKSKHAQRIQTQFLKTMGSITGNRQVCVIQPKEMKNLAAAESQKQAAGISPPDVKGKIIEFLWQLEKDGRKQDTLADYGRKLKQLAELGANLLNSENVKEIISKQPWKDSTKWKYAIIYDGFLKFLKIPWNPPTYKPDREIPFIPTEQELDQLIASSGKKLAALQQLLKETAMRLGEALKLHWTDVDFQQKTIRIKPEKGSMPRIFPTSTKLIEMLNNLPKTSERIFPMTRSSMETNFCMKKKALARKLANPRLLQIHLHTFRHWKATMEYHKTKDIMYVKEILGHKNIANTTIYIHIERALFQNGQPEEYHVKIAKTLEEIKELLEAGFDYVLQKDGLCYFRKRK